MRGCISAECVDDEFTKLQNDSIAEITSDHPRTLLENIKALKRKRTLKPFILTVFSNFFLEFSLCVIWRPYAIQVLKAFGMPINVNYLTTMLSAVNIAGSCCFFFSVNAISKRRMYLKSTAVVVLCSIALSKKVLKKFNFLSIR